MSINTLTNVLTAVKVNEIMEQHLKGDNSNREIIVPTINALFHTAPDQKTRTHGYTATILSFILATVPAHKQFDPANPMGNLDELVQEMLSRVINIAEELKTDQDAIKIILREFHEHYEDAASEQDEPVAKAI